MKLSDKIAEDNAWIAETFSATQEDIAKNLEKINKMQPPITKTGEYQNLVEHYDKVFKKFVANAREARHPKQPWPDYLANLKALKERIKVTSELAQNEFGLQARALEIPRILLNAIKTAENKINTKNLNTGTHSMGTFRNPGSPSQRPPESTSPKSPRHGK